MVGGRAVVTTPVGHDVGVPFLHGEQLRSRCIEAVAEEGARFGGIARQLARDDGLDVPVPWVREWCSRELVGHLGTVHRWAATILRAGTTDPPPPGARPTPPADGLLDWYDEGLAALVATLRDTPPDAPAWHMSPAAEQVAATWARRQAHELVVHRMDLEVAAAVPHAPVDPALAEDGVDELLALVLPRWAHTEPLDTAAATVSVTATDTGRCWSVRLHHGTIRVTSGLPAHADAALAGTASQLLLHLWGRPAQVTVTGDPAADALCRGR